VLRSRWQLARKFGATDTVQERGEDSAARVNDLTDGLSTGSAISPIDLA
jgi:Zn-dependent alcohol dehydrogenase